MAIINIECWGDIVRSISSVHLINFQSHRNLEVDFSQFTGITGPTNKGKTAIIRGIFWCLYNSPSGTDFITHGESVCSVVVRFSDGLEITRVRGNRDNYYDITYPSGETLHLEGFGTGPCEDVVNAHGMREINLISGRDNLNFCKQLDPPFFIGESPTTQALIIGLLGKTDIVDLSIKNTSSEIRSTKAVSKEYKEELKDIKAKLSDLRGLSTMEKAINSAAKNLESMEYIDTKVSNIKELAQKLDVLGQKRENAITMLGAAVDASECDELISKAIEIDNRLSSIKKLNASLIMHIEKYNMLKGIVDKVDIDEVDNLIESIDEFIELSRKLTDIKMENRRLRELMAYRRQFESLPNEEEIVALIENIDRAIGISDTISRINPINDKLKLNLSRRERGLGLIKSFEREYEEVTREYKEGLGEHELCPLCGSGIDKDNIEI